VGQEHLPGAVDLDPLQGRRSSKVLVARNRLLKSTFRPRPRVAAATIVQSLSGEQTHQPTAPTKKTCKRGPLEERLKGFEPSTLCMASRGRDSAQLRISLQIGRFCRASGCRQCPAFTRNHGSFRTETGLALIPPAAGARTSAGSSWPLVPVSTPDSSVFRRRAARPEANDPRRRRCHSKAGVCPQLGWAAGGRPLRRRGGQPARPSLPR
jgi:hypothetical protein